MNEEPNPYEPPASESNGLDVTDPDKLVVLATFNNSMEAHMLKNELAEEGIPAQVANETSANTLISVAGPISAIWIEVLVRKVDADAGLQVKNRFLATNKEAASDIPEWTCTCGELVDAGFAVCWNCQAEFQGQ